MSLSLAALLVAFILLALVRTLRSNLLGIHKNLIGALFFSQLVFVIGIAQTENPVRPRPPPRPRPAPGGPRGPWRPTFLPGGSREASWGFFPGPGWRVRCSFRLHLAGSRRPGPARGLPACCLGGTLPPGASGELGLRVHQLFRS